MKKLIKNFFIFFVVFLLLAALFSSFSGSDEKIATVGIENMISTLNDGQVSSIVVRGDTLEVTLKDDTRENVRKETGESLSSLLANFNVASDKLADVKISVADESGWDYWLTTIVPFVLPVVLIGVFLFFMMRGLQNANSRAMSFGQSTAKDFRPDAKNRTTFKDVAGSKEAKEELQEIVEFLRFPKKFHELGAKIPRGVLLLGAPGTGKTLLARSVAGEAQVPFFHMSGSEFVEMFVGVGASRVRSLFDKAKHNAPCILFIDEIDAVGRKRGAGLGGSHDEREQTLNQILVEMDGFEPTQNIIVIAATNRPDVLDPALLRPGRFDRRVTIDLPDLNDREAILKVHVQKKPLAKDANLRTIAERTAGFSGADLANLLNEAAILAARNSKKEIVNEDMFEAIEKVMIGPERRSRVITDKEKQITAYHEAGHALVAHYLPNADPVHKISIISRGSAGGYTLKVPAEDRHMHAKSEFIDEIAVLLAGHLVERKIYGEVTTGATSDLRRATEIARRLVTDYGMSDNLGSRTYGEKEEMIFLGREIHEQRNYSEKVAERIDEEISGFIMQGEVKAVAIINEQKNALEKIVAVLLDKETIEREEFEKIVGAKPGANPDPVSAV
ncbi:ATP-dependent zinc metalloprotease FtsH [Candidatus Falkowbacteria bacterium]|uniref:ATP-dependent zinc metalloprotease FtsH n=1 Tax=Candidatus Falkowbacteria bacterium CG10_big_fil_rev_8_21_14_0_10_37_18 TaxID=1974562 RepID=A0A2H0V9N4_9BACT|nr:ATP-dependent zinc metalloprotease FtsH [Candidatus Falkowbacteria bacterium]OIO06645.1 MAG: cell division protein FtsH [Candidatus Falkowbacteria bacterium CG1_02_37_21]PIR95817.1 MAG: cell division protein FtsH [Candidatus Falkowbacteria bacterium CG10_big_fil_rev_8_21_14_0_10_37_18]